MKNHKLFPFLLLGLLVMGTNGQAAAADILDYTTPEKLSDQLFDYTFTFDGDLYQLPLPVSALMENGWEPDEKSDQTVASGEYGWCYLLKDNEELRCMVDNFGSEEAGIADCYITDIEAFIYDCNVEMTIAGGITIGMGSEELLLALEGISYETDDDSESFTYYLIADPDEEYGEIEIMVDKETGLVCGIEVEFYPEEFIG